MEFPLQKSSMWRWCGEQTDQHIDCVGIRNWTAGRWYASVSHRRGKPIWDICSLLRNHKSPVVGYKAGSLIRRLMSADNQGLFCSSVFKARCVSPSPGSVGCKQEGWFCHFSDQLVIVRTGVLIEDDGRPHAISST